MRRKSIITGIALLVGLIAFIMSFETIDEGDRGIVFTLGRADRVVEPGFYFINPFLERVTEIDVTTNKVEATASAATKDLQTVSATIAVNYTVDITHLIDLYKQYNTDYEARVIVPAIQEEVKAATAKYTAEEVITKRQEVRDEIFANIKARVSASNMIVNDVLITNFDFSPSFNEAIEAKVTAEQDALKAKNNLERVQFEADARIAQARGEAEAIRIQTEAINKAGGKEYVQLKAIEKWNGTVPQYMTGDAIPFLNFK